MVWYPVRLTKEGGSVDMSLNIMHLSPSHLFGSECYAPAIPLVFFNLELLPSNSLSLFSTMTKDSFWSRLLSH